MIIYLQSLMYSLPSNIVLPVRHCTSYKTLYFLRDIVFPRRQCISYETLYFLWDIVLPMKHCTSYEIFPAIINVLTTFKLCTFYEFFYLQSLMYSMPSTCAFSVSLFQHTVTSSLTFFLLLIHGIKAARSRIRTIVYFIYMYMKWKLNKNIDI